MPHLEIDLLVPARDAGIGIGIGAINHGADSVYTGGKPCELHAIGKIRQRVLKQAAAVPMPFYRTRPAART